MRYTYRTPSTSTDISSNQLETFDVSGRHIIYNDEIYTDDIPSILPSTYGTNGEYMSTDGSGNLLFQSGTSGNNIYYNTGNVGIGVITPTEKKNETNYN